MGRMCCGCLNVKLHSKKPLPEPLTPEQLGPSLDENDDFFSLPLTEIQLDLEGIRIEQPCLIRQREVSDWTIHECVICEMQTHAIHKKQGTNKVLINTSLKSDPTILERLENSSDFSPLYKIILHSKNDNYAARSLGVQSSRYESIQHHLNTVQQNLNKFLQDEQNALEERIRLYEEQQRSAFAELSSKARRDKNTMISLIMSMEEQDSDSDIMPDSPVSPFSPQPDATEGVDHVSEALTDESNFVPSMRMPDLKSLPKKPANKLGRAVPRPQVLQPQKEDMDDPLFDMDGVDFDDSRPFYNSDDENDSTDDSTPEDSGQYQRRSNVPQRTLLSSSVPISVPRWHRMSAQTSTQEEEEDSMVPVPQGENMAASIKALARSVHGDGTEMFGELPRPRLNTLDMGNL